MSANPHANGGLLRRALRMPDFRDYAITVQRPGTTRHFNTKPTGELLRDMQIDCRNDAFEHGIDKLEVDDWVWPL